MSIVGELEVFLLSTLALHLDIPKNTISQEEDLIEAGMIDSLGILKLAAFIENKFGVSITDDDMVPENFRNIASVNRMIEEKLGPNNNWLSRA
jgi:acyl carrier protein